MAASDAPAVTVQHPLNTNSEMMVRFLSRAAGMQRLGISEGRLPPGREAFVYHSHATEEEFLYILEGRGQLRVDNETVEVGAGDFIAFPTPSAAHALTNPFSETLVYLMGGEHHTAEVADFPDHRKRLFRTSQDAFIVDHDHISSLHTPNEAVPADAATRPADE
ncbi:MAG: cupin domain-containing protein [Pseudomonadales bacterium]